MIKINYNQGPRLICLYKIQVTLDILPILLSLEDILHNNKMLDILVPILQDIPPIQLDTLLLLVVILKLAIHKILLDIHQTLLDIHQTLWDIHRTLRDIHRTLLDIHQLLLDTHQLMLLDIHQILLDTHQVGLVCQEPYSQTVIFHQDPDTIINLFPRDGYNLPSGPGYNS